MTGNESALLASRALHAQPAGSVNVGGLVTAAEVRVARDDGAIRSGLPCFATVTPGQPGLILGPTDPLGEARVMIVDDCKLHRENLAALITVNGAADVCAAWDLTSLISAVRISAPSIMLLNVATNDNAMLLRAALEIAPHIRVIVLGVSEDDESGIVACAEAGAAGYHTRGESIEDLLVLIAKVAAGESVCSPRVSAILLRRLSTLASQRTVSSEEFVLTAREAEILRMLTQGLSNRDIAERLCIAVHTVKNHVHSLLTKLGVNTRGQAAALAHTVL